MKSSNPIFRNLSTDVINAQTGIIEKAMTLSGTMTKLLTMSIIMLISAGIVYYNFSLKHMDVVVLMTLIGAVAGFILSIIISVAPKTAPTLAPLYAFAEGALLSGISCSYEFQYQGIVIQAISITMLVVISNALLYYTGIIRPGRLFRSVVYTACCAIFIFYLIAFLNSLIFHNQFSYFTYNSPLNIGINILIALVAAAYILIDFDNISRGCESNIPAFYEWYFAFGLLLSIVWLYVEILRLLVRFRNR